MNGRSIIVLICFVFHSSLASAQTIRETRVIADSTSTIRVSFRAIANGSDSLWLQQRLLIRGIDYLFDSSAARYAFGEGVCKIGDTITVQYHLVQPVVPLSYGRAISTNGQIESVRGGSPEVPVHVTDLPEAASVRRFDIRGAKTFRIQSSGSGESAFGQSLDLSIDGELDDSLFLSGSLTDRQHPAQYGPLNSRLDELDRLRLQLSGPRFVASIGDQSVAPILGNRPSALFGGYVNYRADQYSVAATLGRPRGRKSTFKFVGRDNFQGPYLLSSNDRSQSVVPGSVVVWLDGKQLSEGSGDDYTIDYPLGGIVFTAAQPITSRSRVEVDFEPLATAYRQQLISTSGGFAAPDSSVVFQIGLQQQSDDQDDRLAGDLTEQDKRLLQESGDSAASRSAIAGDSTGAYTFLSDSLPDTVLVFVGAGRGTHRATFTFIGKGQGRYRYRGLDQYAFVGAGGDYEPVFVLVPPERESQGVVSLHVRPLRTVETSIRAIGLSRDRNQFSAIDDQNNSAGQLSAEMQLRDSGMLVEQVEIAGRIRSADFRPTDRIELADDNRTFLITDSIASTASPENRWSAKIALNPITWLSIRPRLLQLERGNSFRSTRGEMQSLLQLTQRHHYQLSAARTRSRLRVDNADRHADASELAVSATVPATGRLDLSWSVAADERESDFTTEPAGTRELRLSTGVQAIDWSISVERLLLDSLRLAIWTFDSRTDKLLARTQKRFGPVAGNILASYQQRNGSSGRDRQFLTTSAIQWELADPAIRVSQDYTVSSEQRNARQLRYLQVQEGEGDYIFVDSQYLPDPNGNYIRIEELLSDNAAVRVASKQTVVESSSQHHQFRLVNRLSDELLPQATRSAAWLFPFVNQPDQPALLFQRQYDVSLQLFPQRGLYLLQIEAKSDLDNRFSGTAASLREDNAASLTFRQFARSLVLEERCDFFRYARSAYLSRSEVVTGLKLSGGLRRTVGATELGTNASFRSATNETGEFSRTISVGGLIRQQNRAGEIRASIEAYRLRRTNEQGIGSLLLTDNRLGTLGMLWSFQIVSAIQRGVRMNGSLSGQASNRSTGRVSGRLEVTADL